MTTTDLELNQWPLGGHPHRRTPAPRTAHISWSPCWTAVEVWGQGICFEKVLVKIATKPWRTIRDASTGDWTSLAKFVHLHKLLCDGQLKLKGISTRMMWRYQVLTSGKRKMIMCTCLFNWSPQVRRHGKGTPQRSRRRERTAGSQDFPSWAWRWSLVPMLTNGPVRRTKNGWVCIGTHSMHMARMIGSWMLTDSSRVSWTIETPSTASWQASSEGGEGPPVPRIVAVRNLTVFVEGILEEAPSNGAGGSYPVASLQKIRPLPARITKLQLLRSAEANLAKYVNEEIGHVDITIADQAWYRGVLIQAVLHKFEADGTVVDRSIVIRCSFDRKRWRMSSWSPKQ